VGRVGGRVGGRVEAGAGDGLLDEDVDRGGVHRLGPGPVAGGDGTEDGTVGDRSGGEPSLEGRDGATGDHPGPGEDGQLGLFAGLVGLGAADGQDEAVGVLGDLIDGEGGELGAAEGGDEPDEEQGPVPEAGQVRFRWPRG